MDLETAVSVNLNWQSGLDGGHPQRFYILLHPAATTVYTENPRNTIPDPGLVKVVKHTVTGLKPKTHYQFQVMAINKLGAETSAVVNATTRGKY